MKAEDYSKRSKEKEPAGCVKNGTVTNKAGMSFSQGKSRQGWRGGLRAEQEGP
jgi:hypothetical protein